VQQEFKVNLSGIDFWLLFKYSSTKTSATNNLLLEKVVGVSEGIEGEI
jgi:hypothetical protein